MKRFGKVAITGIISILVASSAYIYQTPHINEVVLGTITVQNTILEDEGSTIALTGLNVRAEPNIKSKVVGTIPYNSKVELVEKSGDFYKIKYNNDFAYVHCKYVKVVEHISKVIDESGESTATPTTTAASTTTTTSTTKATSSTPSTVVLTKEGIVAAFFGLNVRSDANLQGKKLGLLSNKTKIEITEKVGDWYKIKYNKGFGYVYSKYVKLVANTLDTNNVTEKKN